MKVYWNRKVVYIKSEVECEDVSMQQSVSRVIRGLNRVSAQSIFLVNDESPK